MLLVLSSAAGTTADDVVHSSVELLKSSFLLDCFAELVSSESLARNKTKVIHTFFQNGLCGKLTVLQSFGSNKRLRLKW